MSDKITPSETVSFHRMDEGTAEDYAMLRKQEQNFITALPSRIVSALENLEHSLSGYQVSRLEHSLQTATRAEQGGADKELIVAALIHDIGDDLAPENHSQLAAAIIRPYVRAEVSWILEMHGVFQTYYYADKIGLNKNERDRWRDHHWFDACEKFCHDWDQVSFDPTFPAKRLDYFIPMIYEIFSRPAFNPDIIKSEIIQMT